MPRQVSVHRPLICPECKTELTMSASRTSHCTCCGNTWVEHMPHGVLWRERCGE